EQLLVVDGTDGLEAGVQQRGGVALGEDQVIVARIVRSGEVHAQMPVQQAGQQVRGGHGRRRVSGTRCLAGPDRVDSELLREFMAERRLVHATGDAPATGGSKPPRAGARAWSGPS